MTEFKKEFAAVWPRITNKPLFFAVLAAWFALFHFIGNSSFGYYKTPSLLQWMYNTYNEPSSDDSHGILIPFAVLGLIWWKRKQLLELPQRSWWPGVVLVTFAVLLHVAGYVVQQPRISIAAFFLGLYGLVGLSWGPKWMKATLFPFVLFAYSMPLSSLDILTKITLPLRILAAAASTAIAHGVLGLDVIRQGTMIFNPNHNFSYEVAAACSGIRSLIALSALMLIYSMMTFDKPWKRAVIVLLSLPLALLCNILRVLAMVIMGETFGQPAAKRTDDTAWILTFALAVVAMFVISHFWAEKRNRPVAVDLEEAA
jgi:exosortase